MNHSITSKKRKMKITLKYCRGRGDMIEVFKILHGYYNVINSISLLSYVDVATRGNKYKL